MRFHFEKSVNKYNDAIKDSLKDLSKDGRAISKTKKEELVTAVAASSFTDTEAESKIYDIQKKKQEKMKKFKDIIGATRKPDGSFVHPEIKKDLPLVMKNPDGGYFVKTPQGNIQSVTLGDMMTDHEWGIEYTFDKSVDIHTVRNYYLEQLKGDLREKLDEQIIESETHFTRGDTAKQNAYLKIKERMGKDLEQQGVIAEKMVKNFLKKLAIDAHADFEVIDADVFQDVENKADFIIRRKNVDRAKGAKVIESESVTHPTFEDIGVQFTNNTDADKQAHKESQIRASKRHLKDMQDLVLVTLPAHDAGKLYQKWVQTKKPGGPEKGWNPETKEAIFRGVMAKVLDQEEIDRLCETAFGTSHVSEAAI